MIATRLAGPVFGACIGLVTPAFGYSDVGFVIHMQQTSDVTDCDAPGSPVDPLLDCCAINEVGNLGFPQKAWVIAYGWSITPGFPYEEGLGSAELGIEWDPAIDVLMWVNCTGGTESPDPGWPASQTGISVSWPEPYHQPSLFARIGYFVIAQGSEGRMAVTRHLDAQPQQAARLISGGTPPFVGDVPEAGFSTADVGGTNPDQGVKSCLCGIPAVVGSSWGQVKAAYDH